MLFVMCVLVYATTIFVISKYLWKNIHETVKFNKLFFFIPFYLICLFPLASVANYFFTMDSDFMRSFSGIGFVLAALIFYLVAIVLAADIFIFIIRKISRKADALASHKAKFIKAISCSVLAVVITAYGVFSMYSTSFTFADIGSGDKTIRIAAVSDIHYGSAGIDADLENLVNKLNTLDADIVVLAGDVLDNHAEKVDQKYFAETMSQIKSTYGIFAVSGNHEYSWNNLEQLQEFYKGSGIVLLSDKAVDVGDIRLAGRTDYIFGGLSDTRVPLDEILSDSSKPLVVLDHQPQDYAEAMENNAVLQISGHTHNGQLFPYNLLIGAFYALKYNTPIYGINNYGNFTLAVSRGYKGWGFPMKTTGSSEIMCIDLKY